MPISLCRLPNRPTVTENTLVPHKSCRFATHFFSSYSIICIVFESFFARVAELLFKQWLTFFPSISCTQNRTDAYTHMPHTAQPKANAPNTHIPWMDFYDNLFLCARMFLAVSVAHYGTKVKWQKNEKEKKNVWLFPCHAARTTFEIANAIAIIRYCKMYVHSSIHKTYDESGYRVKTKDNEQKQKNESRKD